ncbi:MAG: hypothetical protein JNM90_24575, partial [Burkholderiales bacterium]|nr:hypothetical protein [Burkholderiales bacterium]
AAPARHCLELAARLAPTAALPEEMLGFCGYVCGDIDRAQAAYARALALADAGERGVLEINRLINTLPQIAPSAAALATARAAFAAGLARLVAAPPPIDDPLAAINRTPFFLTYQGFCDRDLSAALARLFLAACPALGEVAPQARRPRPLAGRRPRVGFVSMHLGRHSVGVWYRAYVRALIESGRLEAVLFTYGADVDPALAAAAERAGGHEHIGPTLAQARQCIAARALDMLIYTDVAMHPFPYFLSMSRLAPVQALLVGHPATSGVPAIDYFISNVHQDAADAQAHYTERLVRLPLIPVWVEPTPLPARPPDRAALGLGTEARIYLCPMMLQKLHPDFDAALRDILAGDDAGEIVLFADPARALWQEQLEARFERSLGALAARVTFRPFAAREEFVDLLRAADCVLDPYHFSGGVTTYIVLSQGCPLVTLPGALFRSRMSAGMLEQAGLGDMVARSHAHYVELAHALARDAGLRRAWSARILAAHPRLFATAAAVPPLLDWIEATVRGQAVAS